MHQLPWASACPLLLVLLLCYSIQTHAAVENLPVTCGSTIKLMHVASKFRLHSHEVAYSRGSQQQSVTAYPTSDDGNSLWIVLGTPSEPCVPGDSIKKGKAIRLQHVGTRKWLHSHHFQSPLSGNLEVSAFGSDVETDTGDVWVVEWDSKPSVWKQETKVRLKHEDTDHYLYSHEMRFGQPISGQQEVCCVQRKDRNAEWQAAEGVYFPSNKKGKQDKDEL